MSLEQQHKFEPTARSTGSEHAFAEVQQSRTSAQQDRAAGSIEQPPGQPKGVVDGKLVMTDPFKEASGQQIQNKKVPIDRSSDAIITGSPINETQNPRDPEIQAKLDRLGQKNSRGELPSKGIIAGWPVSETQQPRDSRTQKELDHLQKKRQSH